MLSMLRRRASYANVTATLALFVALGGTGYAAIKLPANSVSTKQIKNRAVTRQKLASSAVDSSKIRNRSVAGIDLAVGSVETTKVRDGSLAGADINLTTLGKVPLAAKADVAALTEIKRVSLAGQNAAAPMSSFDVKSPSVSCPAGFTAVGGGVSLTDQTTQVVNDSYPAAPGAWAAHVFNFGSGTPGFTIWVICLPAAVVD
jgi:hypothetical protein